MRLPYVVQADEHEAQASVDFIEPDERHTINIGSSVKALAAEVKAFDGLPATSVDFVLGNTKARMRMVAQYTVAGAYHGLVIGTDHAAEAVMGFFTKFGDGACDLAPLSGLVKNRYAPSPAISARRNHWSRKCRLRTGRPVTWQTGRSLARRDLRRDRRLPARRAGTRGSLPDHLRNLRQDPAQARIALRTMSDLRGTDL